MVWLVQDEDVYTFFEPELPPDTLGVLRSKVSDASKVSASKRQGPKPPPCTSSFRGQGKSQQQQQSACTEKKSRRSSAENNTCWNVLDLKKENYFSVAVGRKRTNARYLLNSSDDVVAFLKLLAETAGAS